MNRKTLLLLGLVALFMLAACSPTAPPPVPPEADLPAPTTAPPAENEAQAEPAEAVELPDPTVEAPTVIPMPTSRGEKLQASEPASFQPATGEPQLLEFFAFW